MRKGRLGRLARLGGMAAGLATDAAGAAARLTTARTEEAAASFHRHAARRMLRVFGEMKGLPLKAGQMLSYVDEVIPAEHRHIYNEVLGNLQLHTPTMEPDDMDEEMQVVIEDYMHLTFEPFTRPQPYRFTREYTQQLLRKGMDAKMVLTRKMLTGKAGQLFEAQHEGVAFLGRINFGLGAILTALETQADFRAMLAAMHA